MLQPETRTPSMKSTGLLIAAAVLAALTGVLYWSNHRKVEDTTPATPAAVKLLSIKDADVNKIEIAKKRSEQVELSKGGDVKWAIIAPQSLSGDQDAITGVLSVLSGLNSERVVEDHAIDLKQYGLADPSIKVDLPNKDGK